MNGLITGSFERFILIAGPSLAGKTYVGDRLAAVAHSSSRSSFSAGLRMLAREDLTIEQLQDAGQYYAMNNWQALWSATVEIANPRSGSNLIIDGIRHRHIIENLRSLGLRVTVLTLIPTRATLEARAGLRIGDSRNREHIIEAGYDDIGYISDVTLRGSLAIVSDFYALCSLLGLDVRRNLP